MTTGLRVRSAIDTVERFQGGEWTVILVSATESDLAYLLASSVRPVGGGKCEYVRVTT